MNCQNCRCPTNELELCQACAWLLHRTFEPKRNGETQPFVNRRWQFYFHRGELTDFTSDPGVVWIRRGDKTIGI